MSKKKPRRVGMLRLAAPVEISPEQTAIDVCGIGRMRHQLTILAHALRAFGPFRLGRDLLPCAGAFDVDVLADDNSEDAVFDHNAFGAFLRQLNQAIAATPNCDCNGAELTAAAEDVAVRIDRDPVLISRLFEALRKHTGVTVVDGQGSAIELTLSRPTTPQGEATIDVDVAGIDRYIRVDTGNNSYVIPESPDASFKRGDKIQAVDAGAVGGMRCISADAATTIPDPPSPGLFD